MALALLYESDDSSRLHGDVMEEANGSATMWWRGPETQADALKAVANADALAWINAGMDVESACRIVAEINLGWQGSASSELRRERVDTLQDSYERAARLELQSEVTQAELVVLSERVVALCVLD